MKHPFNKKRFWLVIGLLVLAEALTFCLVKQWNYIFPSSEVSEVYSHYADVDGINASFVKDYKINDTVFVDVTMLEATTDSAWDLLQNDFNLPTIPKEYESFFYADSNKIALKSINKKNPSFSADSTAIINDIAAISFPKHTICVFSVTNNIELKAVLRNQYDYIK